MNEPVSPEDHLLQPPSVRASILLQQFLRMHMELFPPIVDMGRVERIIDVACGAGQWVRDVADKYILKNVAGLDQQRSLLTYARSLTPFKMRGRVSYVEGDMRVPLIVDNFYDVVQLRFVSSAVFPHAWESLLLNWMRACRAGGYVVWTESHVPVAESVACFFWVEMLRQAYARIGTMPFPAISMESLLSRVGCRSVRSFETTIDCSAGTPAHSWMMEHLPALLSVMQPFLRKMGVVTGRQLDQLSADVLANVSEPSFRGYWTLITVVGVKPYEQDVPFTSSSSRQPPSQSHR